MNNDDAFRAFFQAACAHDPHPYQSRFALGALPETLVIPTGFGKTATVIAGWLWKRNLKPIQAPRRLIYCLPMRTLVEQTAEVARRWVDAAAVHFGWSQDERPTVEVLMGGEARERGAPDWIIGIDRPAILIGTQDMLVSAALMRGYGVARYRWPVDFALLHSDALWVFDEVQLAGATLPTSAQLEAWRRDETLFPRNDTALCTPASTLWMSATLEPTWLKTVDFNPASTRRGNDLQTDDLTSAHAARLWGAAKRLTGLRAPASLKSAKDVAAHAEQIVELVRDRLTPDGSVLIFLNTVARAQAAYQALRAAGIADVVLLHSRYRPPERRAATERALADPRVIVTTQALEAGVDLTSRVMITELAPWSSMVQRIGRCNRYGECGAAGGAVLWIDLPAGEEAPYEAAELDGARGRLQGLTECGPMALSRIDPSPPAPSPIIRRRDLLDLFDTEADLSGFDVDVSMYVREVDDVDVRLFWRDVPANGSPDGVTAAAPVRDELCSAPLAGVRDLLKRRTTRAWRADSLGRGGRVWLRLPGPDLRPGMEVMISADSGGYHQELGFGPGASGPVSHLPEIGEEAVNPPGLDEEPDTLVGAPVSLQEHSRHVRDEAERLCAALMIDEPMRGLLVEAALWHDRGKAHGAFQQMLSPDWCEGDDLLAKSERRPRAARPRDADRSLPPSSDLRRPRFRHELASSLAYFDDKGWTRDADLGAYLIAAHHGKVRMRLRALPKEWEPADDRLFARGVWDGDTLPVTEIADERAPAVTLDLELMKLGEGRRGPSWSTRTQALLRTHGPFRLAWMEAIVRIADWRASAAEGDAAARGEPFGRPWQRRATESVSP